MGSDNVGSPGFDRVGPFGPLLVTLRVNRLSLNLKTQERNGPTEIRVAVEGGIWSLHSHTHEGWITQGPLQSCHRVLRFKVWDPARITSA